MRNGRIDAYDEYGDIQMNKGWKDVTILDVTKRNTGYQCT